MRNIIRKVVLILGIVLLVGSAATLTGMRIKLRKSKAANADTVAYFDQLLPERTAGSVGERGNTIMPLMSHDGKDYAALLELPAHSIRLPVLSEWSRFAIDYTPCRFSGNPYDGSLILGGADTDCSFSFVTEVESGDKFTLTDMQGVTFRYTVASVDHAKNADEKTLTAKPADLVLFVRAKQSHDYVIVRCKLL